MSFSLAVACSPTRHLSLQACVYITFYNSGMTDTEVLHMRVYTHSHTHTRACVWTASGNTSKCRIPLFTSHIRLTSKSILHFRPEFSGQTDISASQGGDEEHCTSHQTRHQHTCTQILQHGLKPGRQGFDLWTFLLLATYNVSDSGS